MLSHRPFDLRRHPMASRVCNICTSPRTLEEAPEVASVRCNVREFQGETFTVWRCANCRALHSLEDIDYGRYYGRYPIQQQELDFFTRRLFASRLRELVRGGLRRTHSLLDYGCGNGAFVLYLRERGYARAEGYDPYSRRFAAPAVLQRQFDFVVSQDVIEHAPEPLRLLDELIALVQPARGVLAIGTPDAARLRLGDPMEAVGRLHQPYHRHLFAADELARQLGARGLRVTRTVRRWYVDTWFPFLNSTFFFRYVAAAGGMMDAVFEPIRPGVIARSPMLMFYGLLGRAFQPGKDVLLFAARSDAQASDRGTARS
jgi:2-polyprenyl-3-methyl-5-hydroxy-6-metoxy-1,4-benzoquinol methylase